MLYSANDLYLPPLLRQKPTHLATSIIKTKMYEIDWIMLNHQYIVSSQRIMKRWDSSRQQNEGQSTYLLYVRRTYSVMKKMNLSRKIPTMTMLEVSKNVRVCLYRWQAEMKFTQQNTRGTEQNNMKKYRREWMIVRVLFIHTNG